MIHTALLILSFLVILCVGFPMAMLAGALAIALLREMWGFLLIAALLVGVAVSGIDTNHKQVHEISIRH